MKRQPLLLAWFALGLLALAGCSGTELAVHLAKTATIDTPQSRPLPHAARKDYKLGKPYVIEGAWYYPSYEPYYDRTGIASWYGPSFHGRPTANGERFDMNEVSAAHPTLPLPSRARVTNLENGRVLVVRVNDRGPFINGRLIDLSRRAAQLLGFHRKGLTRVRVQYLGLDRLWPDVPLPVDPPAIFAKGTPPIVFKPRRSNVQAVAEALPPVKPVRAASARPPRARGGAAGALLVEAAVLEGRDAADRLGASVRTLGSVAVEPERRGGRLVYAVRIGPIASNDEAASIVAKLARAGLTNSHIVAAGYR